jgi:hypothetical protein
MLTREQRIRRRSLWKPLAGMILALVLAAAIVAREFGYLNNNLAAVTLGGDSCTALAKHEQVVELGRGTTIVAFLIRK